MTLCIQRLRLPRLKAGDSDQLLLRSFRLRSANASHLGAVSSGPSTGRVRPKPAPVAPTLSPCRPALRPFGGVCAEPNRQRVVPLACVEHHVQSPFVLLPLG